MTRIAVLRPGSRTTVEDLGRTNAARWGVPPGGAFDAVALVAANRLVGNRDDDAGLELTLAGPDLRNDGPREVAVAVVGAEGEVRSHGGATRRCRSGEPAALRAGESLHVGALGGARAWLALAGGIAVPPKLGSRSTCAHAGFGGFAGRPLRAGDVLDVGDPIGTPASRRPWKYPSRGDARDQVATLRIVAGPQADLHPGDTLALLAATLWTVAPESDRVGVRLTALDPAIPDRVGRVAGIPPEGTTLGAVQMPPSGDAIVLGPDRPVTGGYAKPALVIRADIGEIARLVPGRRVRFAPVPLADAVAADRQRRDELPPASLGAPREARS
ncbi:MAG TPA: biotin-dependent carboxyltransferase family protein [Candidatus Binatia bacterium]|nr:biotin-dependent carboxyltransferase family protein [Candidatus Binatia bacterium]